MFRRKAKDSGEVSAVEEQAAAVTAEPVSESVEGAESPSEAAGAATAEQRAEETEADEVVEAAATESVEIPKQQSAEQAADNETAGEGARK
ncbi:hypothetical protein [Streptomyces sp. cg35]|uniref:hypothetical protein n=1 Tax=Streptomyces sp. cg35 TaxID=3421650 RepID=UPI003D166BD4